MSFEPVLLVALGALIGGLASGLTGFGTGIAAMGIWLYAVSPSTAASLVIVCALAGQLQTLPTFWYAIEPRSILILIVPGLAAVPIGTALLSHLDASIFRIGIGAVLLIYVTLIVATRHSRRSPNENLWLSGLVGSLGGIMGGLAGLSGPPVTIWSGLMGWTKDRRRGVFQAFNTSILIAALASHAAGGLVTKKVAFAAAVALPATFLGAWAGIRVYRRLSDQRFDDIVLAFLFCMGLLLIWSNS